MAFLKFLSRLGKKLFSNDNIDDLFLFELVWSGISSAQIKMLFDPSSISSKDSAFLENDRHTIKHLISPSYHTLKSYCHELDQKIDLWKKDHTLANTTSPVEINHELQLFITQYLNKIELPTLQDHNTFYSAFSQVSRSFRYWLILETHATFSEWREQAIQTLLDDRFIRKRLKAYRRHNIPMSFIEAPLIYMPSYQEIIEYTPDLLELRQQALNAYLQANLSDFKKHAHLCALQAPITGGILQAVATMLHAQVRSPLQQYDQARRALFILYTVSSLAPFNLFVRHILHELERWIQLFSQEHSFTLFNFDIVAEQASQSLKSENISKEIEIDIQSHKIEDTMAQDHFVIVSKHVNKDELKTENSDQSLDLIALNKRHISISVDQNSTQDQEYIDASTSMNQESIKDQVDSSVQVDQKNTANQNLPEVLSFDPTHALNWLTLPRKPHQSYSDNKMSKVMHLPTIECRTNLDQSHFTNMPIYCYLRKNNYIYSCPIHSIQGKQNPNVHYPLPSQQVNPREQTLDIWIEKNGIPTQRSILVKLLARFDLRLPYLNELRVLSIHEYIHHTHCLFWTLGSRHQLWSIENQRWEVPHTKDNIAFIALSVHSFDSSYVKEDQEILDMNFDLSNLADQMIQLSSFGIDDEDSLDILHANNDVWTHDDSSSHLSEEVESDLTQSSSLPQDIIDLLENESEDLYVFVSTMFKIKQAHRDELVNLTSIQGLKFPTLKNRWNKKVKLADLNYVIHSIFKKATAEYKSGTIYTWKDTHS